MVGQNQHCSGSSGAGAGWHIRLSGDEEDTATTTETSEAAMSPHWLPY